MAQPAFGAVWVPGPGRPPEVVPVTKPRALRHLGWQLVGCHAFTWGPSRYDFFVIDGNREVLTFTAQGERGLASVRAPGDRRHYVHRLVCCAGGGSKEQPREFPEHTTSAAFRPHSLL
jgi:hypothetical protein